MNVSRETICDPCNREVVLITTMLLDPSLVVLLGFLLQPSTSAQSPMPDILSAALCDYCSIDQSLLDHMVRLCPVSMCMVMLMPWYAIQNLSPEVTNRCAGCKHCQALLAVAYNGSPNRILRLNLLYPLAPDRPYNTN